MFRNLSIKWKLSVLVVVMLMALAVIGMAGYSGIREVGAGLDEVGTVRMPSIQGLLMLGKGQSMVRARTLETAIYENDYKAQQSFASVLEKRRKAWEVIQAGWKQYEPLPQTAEEAVMWKQFEVEWNEWKRVDDLLAADIERLAANKSEQAQKEGFVDFYKHYEQSQPLFTKAEESLNKIIQLNQAIGVDSVKAGTETIAASKKAMLIAALLSAIVAIGFAAYITSTITGPLMQAVSVSNSLAEGDLTVKIESAAKDETGRMLQAMQNMISKLSQVVSEVNSGAEALASASEEVSATAQSLSQASSEQAAGVEETSA